MDMIDIVNEAGVEAGLEPVGYNARLRKALAKRGVQIVDGRSPSGEMLAPLPHPEDPNDTWPQYSWLVRVEVLAAMDEAAQAIEDAWAIYSGAERLVAARAAVAELIEAADDMLDEGWGSRTVPRLRAALSAVYAEFKPA